MLRSYKLYVPLFTLIAVVSLLVFKSAMGSTVDSTSTKAPSLLIFLASLPIVIYGLKDRTDYNKLPWPIRQLSTLVLIATALALVLLIVATYKFANGGLSIPAP
jgi:hypothetical protein